VTGYQKKQIRTTLILIIINEVPWAKNNNNTLGVFNTSANSLLKEIGLKISLNTGESRETSFLYKRISVLVQRFNAVLLHDSLPTVDCTD